MAPRVLQLSKFYPPVPGGIESVVFELTDGLNRAQVHTDVLCANLARVSTCEAWPGGYSVTRCASFGRLMSTSMAPTMLSRLSAAARHYDIIHVHLPDPLANLALWWARPDAQIVVHWHSDIIQQQIALKLYQPLQRWLLERADAIVPTSEDYWKASPWLPKLEGKIRTIPIGIRDLETPPDPATVASIRARFDHRRIVLALGRMVYYKGFDQLIDVARDLPSDVVIVIGGSGPLRPRLQERIDAENLADRIFLPGRIPDQDVAAYFEAADLFCLPSDSRAEAFGVVLLEAMRAGKPIVASNLAGSGVPGVNIDGQTGLNIPTGDRGALAAAITRILDDRALAQAYGRAARNRFLDAFTAEKMVAGVSSLYTDLLRRGTVG